MAALLLTLQTDQVQGLNQIAAPTAGLPHLHPECPSGDARGNGLGRKPVLKMGAIHGFQA